MMHLSGPVGPEREYKLHTEKGKAYIYVGLSPHQQREAEKILRSKHPNKIWSYMKPFAVDYLKGDRND